MAFETRLLSLKRLACSQDVWQHAPADDCMRTLQGRNKLGLRQKFGKEEAVEALQAAEAVVKSERALGQVILSAGYNGEIKVRVYLLGPVKACHALAPCVRLYPISFITCDVLVQCTSAHGCLQGEHHVRDCLYLMGLLMTVDIFAIRGDIAGLCQLGLHDPVCVLQVFENFGCPHIVS